MIPHWVIDYSAPIGGLAVFVIGLMIRNAISDLRTGMIEKIDSIGREIGVHVASDEQKHAAIDGHLVYTDKRVENIERKIFV